MSNEFGRPESWIRSIQFQEFWRTRRVIFRYQRALSGIPSIASAIRSSHIRSKCSRGVAIVENRILHSPSISLNKVLKAQKILKNQIFLGNELGKGEKQICFWRGIEDISRQLSNIEKS